MRRCMMKCGTPINSASQHAIRLLLRLVHRSPVAILAGVASAVQDPAATQTAPTDAAVDLYWLPLGAGGHFVKWNGRIYEAIKAALARRPRSALYHSALQLHLGQETYVIEQAPEPDLTGESRGVVAEGPVGARWAGRFRIFRYEVRVWVGGNIPDVAEAVDSPRRLSEDSEVARRVLGVAPHVPTLVWGRDELGTGEMWNSNSIIAWILSKSGIDTEAVQPPTGGRAPGWIAGLAAAERQGPDLR
jgi:hypothetical protein